MSSLTVLKYILYYCSISSITVLCIYYSELTVLVVKYMVLNVLYYCTIRVHGGEGNDQRGILSRRDASRRRYYSYLTE